MLALVGIAGACLFFGDGVITPAISVLSAVEGLEVAAPALKQFVLPISVVGHRRAVRGAIPRHRRRRPDVRPGDGGVVPACSACSGVIEIVASPVRAARAVAQLRGRRCACTTRLARLRGARRGRAVRDRRRGAVCRHGPFRRAADPAGLAGLRAALPGAELFRPGRAGAAPIPTRWQNPFFLLAPDWLRLPMVILATVATVIASQALISGAYSIARQCMQLGFLPRMTVRHTSATEEGQIYVPQVNTALLVGVLVLVLAFRTSDNLASAYGIAVTGTFLCTCVLATVVFRRQFHWSRAAAVAVFGGFFVIDCVFFAANTAEGAGRRLGAAGARRAR